MKIEDFEIEVKKLGIELTSKQLEELTLFYKLLIDWNTKINLTRITGLEEVYLKHFYDSLTLIKATDLTKDLTLCDVGSGAGFPGIVLKIVFPNLKITLIDSLLKRVNYLNEIIKELELDDIKALHIRAEDHQETYDLVTARAVANLKDLTRICLPLVKKEGYFIAMKANLEEEMIDIEEHLKRLNSYIEDITNFKLPIEDSNRNLVIIKKEI